MHSGDIAGVRADTSQLQRCKDGCSLTVLRRLLGPANNMRGGNAAGGFRGEQQGSCVWGNAPGKLVNLVQLL